MSNLSPGAEMARKELERVKNNIPVPQGSATLPTKRLQRAVVDTEQEIAVQVLYSTIVFRPNQELKDPRLITIAKENGIPIRYK